jgi:phosphoglucosamine mutase
MERLVQRGEVPRPEGAALGRITDSEDAAERYLGHLAGAAGGTLAGMRVVIDCANGAAYRLGPEILRRLGAEVYAIHDEPDGSNINVGCGATHPEAITEAVRRFGAEAGVAHDGGRSGHPVGCGWKRRRRRPDPCDGCPRVQAGGSTGAEHRGVHGHGQPRVSEDHGRAGHQRDRDAGGGPVRAGEMLRRGADRRGAVRAHHLPGSRHHGDGLQTAAWFISEARRRGATIAELAAAIPRYPQVLQNVPVTDHASLDGAGAVWEAVRIAEGGGDSRARALFGPRGPSRSSG